MSLDLANPIRIGFEIMAHAWQPPPDLHYENWARQNIRFSEGESAFPGPYNSNLFPYFSEILAALQPNDPCRIVTMMKSAQLGGTVLANIYVLGSLEMAAGYLLYVHPTEENAARWSKMKLAPMLRSTPSLQAIFASKSRDGSDSVLYKERADGRGAIQISGANSPAGLSMISMMRQVQDDLAKWVVNNAGDPESQADSRSSAFEFAKIFKISTPMVMPGCRITKNFEAGSQEHYYVPCPHCDHKQTLTWENFSSNLKEDEPEKSCFSCCECGGIIEEHHRPAMIRNGEWRAHNAKAKTEHRSFYIWSAYSLLQSFERIARQYIKAKGDPAAEQTFENDVLGRAYRAAGEAPPWEELRKRADQSGHQRGIIPKGYVVVTMGVDIQKDFIAWQVVAWARDMRRAIIDHGQIDGHISDEKAQNALTDLMNFEWSNEYGHKIMPDLTAIDGNAWTEDVWSFAKRHPVSKIIMVRGVASETAPLIARVKKERSRVTGKLLAYSSRFYNFATSILKMSFYRNLLKDDPLQRGFVSLPKGLEDSYYKELTAERRVPVKRKDGHVSYQWVKDQGQANEMLDTMLQAEAASIKLGLRDLPEARWDQYEAARNTPIKEQQLDFEDGLQVLQTQNIPQNQKEQKPQHPQSRFGELARRLNG